MMNALRSASSIVFLTGAGMSADSGIPTFRDKGTGLWERLRPEDLATPEAFRRQRDLVWSWYEWRRMQVQRAQPNPGHLAIAELASTRAGVVILTQNVDDLHERAGSQVVLHLHGSLFASRCFACGRPHSAPVEDDYESAQAGALRSPTCTHCRGKVRPGVVWFGEPLPEAAWKAACEAVDKAEVFVMVGTSAQVYPVADLPVRAKRRGAVLVQINPQPTPIDPLCDWNVRGSAAEEVPRLVRVMLGAADAWGGG